MDFLTVVLGLLFFLTLMHALKSLSPGHKNLPPGPTPLPIIGNLHLLGKHPHKSLTQLSKTHGPIMLLRLGFKNTLVVSSASMAKQVLQTQDLAFSSRVVAEALQSRDNFKHSVIWLPVSPLWRRLRKILNSNIFTATRLDENQHVRRKKVEELIEYCRKNSEVGQAIDLSRAAYTTSFNVLSNMIFSRDWADLFSNSEKGVQDLIEDFMVLAGKPNLVDFFPFLKKLDTQGIRRRMNIFVDEYVKLLNGMIDERTMKRSGWNEEGVDENAIDVLLTISKERPEELGRIDIVTMCADLFAAGTDTSSNTVEWAMAEALRNPEIMRKAKAELDEVIGKGKILEEADVARLPYLQCMVKETLRLHPPAPFLIPRNVDQDVELCGYIVPKDSQVFVNIWAIGRDAETWDDPLEFKPERFVGSEVDVRGRDFELIPFGAGRRICPGVPLATRVVPVMLGSLLNSFDWKLEGDIKPQELDMEEKFGLVLRKANPLRVIPVRSHVN